LTTKAAATAARKKLSAGRNTKSLMSSFFGTPAPG
jgi:hypothetical protein